VVVQGRAVIRRRRIDVIFFPESPVLGPETGGIVRTPENEAERHTGRGDRRQTAVPDGEVEVLQG
jgi:hypothetical protein